LGKRGGREEREKSKRHRGEARDEAKKVRAGKKRRKGRTSLAREKKNLENERENKTETHSGAS
jgi:hypothetical protein